MDMAEIEEERALKRRNKRGLHHRSIFSKMIGRKIVEADKYDDGEPDIYRQQEVDADRMMYPMEMSFGSSRFANGPSLVEAE